MPHNPLPSVESLTDLSGTYVLVRSSLNVPIENGKVINTFRLKQGAATLRWLSEQNARVIVIGHIQRDDGLSESLLSVSNALQEIIPHTFVQSIVGPEVQAARSALSDGEILLLENTRQDKREKTNDYSFAKELATLADIFVNDAFSVGHRSHASMVGVAKYLPTYAGVQFMKEFNELSKAREPQPPSLFMIGGAKFETKMPLLEKYLELYDKIFVGGALANDLLKAKGCEVGQSLVSDIDLSGNPLLNHPNLLTPIDVAVQVGASRRTTVVEDVRADEVILDIGPATVEMLAPHIKAAQTILWNGPFGNYEEGFAKGTEDVAKLVGESNAYSVVGGGDTVAAIDALNISHQFNFLSTAGGAMLQFLEHGTLPAIEAIQNAPATKQL